ncbi:MAG: Plug domain-containing protein, partial [Bacteroidota bacterium]|nr:Plug domain-containing protein [Bacteroidota bacterium]
MQALCPFLLGKSRRVLLWWALCWVPAWCSAQSEPAAAVHGHVLQSASQRPLSEVLVMAWPCGLASTTDTWGAFRVACPHGVDSLTLVSEGHHTTTVKLEGLAHVDVWLEPLGFSLSQATVSAVRLVEAEGQTLDAPDLMRTLDNTPGLQSLDLGAGMIQPMVRGLFGSRVAVLEDGVPQQGGRWGSDHGVLVAPELQFVTAWVPGGGQVWMGPEAVAGGLRFQSPSILNTEGQHTSWGSMVRLGQTQAAFHVLHASTEDEAHWHAGISMSAFGASQVPQREFSYLDRTYT